MQKKTDPKILAAAQELAEVSLRLKTDLKDVVDEMVRLKAIEVAAYSRDLKNGLRAESVMDSMRDLQTVLFVAQAFTNKQYNFSVPV